MVDPRLGRVPAVTPARLRGVLAALVALVALVLVGPSSAAAAGLAAGLDTGLDAGRASAGQVHAEDEPVAVARPVVLVGVGGLHWDDVDRTGTPTLWRMVDEGSVGSISVHVSSTQTCRLGGWLTVSAGRRVPPPGTADPAPSVGPDGGEGRSDEPSDEQPGGSDELDDCPGMPTVDASARAPGAPGTPGKPGPAEVVGWDALVDPPADDVPPGAYGAPGTVATLVAPTRRCTTAVGPGAALALADATGTLARYAPLLGSVDDAALRVCPVTVVDGGELPADRAQRREALSVLDDQLRRILAAVDDGTRVVVAGMSDGLGGETGLQAVVQWRAGGGPVGWLTSDSTRRTGIVTLTDLAATLVDAAGADAADLDGAPLEVGADRRMTADRTIENRRYLTEMTTVAPHLVPLLLGVVGVAAALVVGAVLVLRRRRRTPPPTLRRLVVAVLLLGACTPVGAQLAAASRWWGSPAPLFAASAWWGVATVATALVAWLVARVLPPGRWRLATVAAAVTWCVVTVDGLTGTVLQQGSVLAISTLGARYYGFGNTTFGVYAASGLVLAAGLAAYAGSRRRVAVGAVAAVGVATVVVDGWPAFGADFGGVLALVPAFAVLAVAVAGGRVRARRLVAYLVAAVGVVAVVSVVDWARPGRGTHLGQFVQRVLDGQALDVVAGKAQGAWATVATPLGAVAAVVCLAACVALVGPDRWRPTSVRRLYDAWPGLRRLLLAVVVAAVLGSVLNDSGVVVASAVLATSGALLVVSFAEDRWAALPDDPAPVRAPLRRMPAVLVATGGGLLAALLVATVVLPLPAAVAGDVPTAAGRSATPTDRPVVLVGTSGVQWSDVDRQRTPTLWGLLRDGAPAGGVTPGASGRNAWCPTGGWLALSSGRAAVAGATHAGRWTCAPWAVTTTDAAVPDGGAVVVRWDGLTALQSRSEFRPRLGALGEGLAASGTCSTAVGARAALALALPDGTVPRYRSLDAALADPADAFACPTTVVDAGTAVPDPLLADLLGPQAELDALRDVDRTVARVLRAVPDGATVLVVDTGNAARGPVALGVGIGDPSTGAGFLGSAATRWEGVLRLLDVPVSLLVHVDAAVSDDFAGSPVRVGEDRPAAVATTVRQLADLTTRDRVLRGTSTPVTTPPLVLGLLVVVGAAVLGPPLARRRPRLAERLRRVADAVLLVLAALPVGLFLMTTTSWWRFADPGRTMWLACAGATAAVAGVAALAPRRPLTVGPGVVAGVTFAVLTLDALLGTPLHRGSPQGPAVTLGGRFYGFGNPTYSFYVVAALVSAALWGWALVRRGHRLLGAAVAALVCGTALVVDLWPALGADVGGGLVLVPAGLVVVLGVAGVRVTWFRLLVAGVVGVLLVGGIAVLDWLRPAADRTHLGVFVQRVVDGSAAETISRKLGYAAATVTSGWVAVLTMAVLVLVVAVLWPRSRVRVPAWEQLERRWPPVRPVLVGLLVAAVAGGLVNDYGVRIATVILVGAVPLLGCLGLRAAADGYPAEGPADARDDEPSTAP